MGGGGDVRVLEFHAVVQVSGVGLGCKSSVVEHRIHEISGAIASERTTRAVGTMRSWCEAEDDDPGIDVSEAGNGLRPIFPIHVGAALLAPYLFPIGDQPRTQSATRHLFV